MASSKYHLAFFLIIALIAAAVPLPSAAARAEPPSSTTGAQPSKWHKFCFWPFYSPAPPTKYKPYPKECLPWMMGLMPCKDLITNKTALPPPPFPAKCCDGFKSLVEDAPICLCHLDDGGFDKVLSAPIDEENFFHLAMICDSDGPADYGSCDGSVPPVRAAPTPEAAP